MKNLRILLVDDDRVTLLTIKHFFKEKVARFHSVGNAETAVSILEGDPDWDVVISDYVLPGMDGGAFLKKAKELQPKLRTILITGYDLGDMNGVLKDSRIDHFITKPLSMESIQYALATIQPG